MDTLVAVGHIVGAFFAIEAWTFVTVTFAAWGSERRKKEALQEIALALAIPVGELDHKENSAKVIQYLTKKYSPELLRNRLSDFCSSLQALWKWLTFALQYGTLIAVAWWTATDSLAVSAKAWLALAIAILLYLPTLILGWACILATGRGPGDARNTRERLSQIISD
jgi:hypothetical protein